MEGGTFFLSVVAVVITFVSSNHVGWFFLLPLFAACFYAPATSGADQSINPPASLSFLFFRSFFFSLGGNYAFLFGFFG
jgi:hypothetical protein